MELCTYLLVDEVTEDLGRPLGLLNTEGGDLGGEEGREDLARLDVLQPVQDLAQDAERRSHDAAARGGGG